MVGGEAVGRDPVEAEVVEAAVEQFAAGFGGVAVAGVDEVKDPSEFDLPSECRGSR